EPLAERARLEAGVSGYEKISVNRPHGGKPVHVSNVDPVEVEVAIHGKKKWKVEKAEMTLVNGQGATDRRHQRRVEFPGSIDGDVQVATDGRDTGQRDDRGRRSSKRKFPSNTLKNLKGVRFIRRVAAEH